jgi:hypothetical protein
VTARITRPYYFGTTAVLKAGDEISLPVGEAGITIDPAQALADAWRAVESGGFGVPHVYEVSAPDGKPFVILSDVFIDGTLAWRAMQIADNT